MGCCSGHCPDFCLADGKISQLVGDFGKGLKSFKKGVKEDGPEVVKLAQAATQNTSEAQPKKSTVKRGSLSLYFLALVSVQA